ncbi:MAG: anthrone oxygenase family protein [Rhodospirillaceae bacterium]
MQTATDALLWFSAIGCGLIAGIYFAFSTFIVTALDRIGHAQGAAAMNSINSAILGSLFMPLFFGTTIAGAALAVLALLRWGEPATGIMLAGGLVHVVGMFICTVVCNVPLNNELGRSGSSAADVWARYLKNWTFWNHVRTLASTAATALFMAAIVARASAG